MAKNPNFNEKKTVSNLQAEYGKMPPQAIDLEEAVLGALMLERDAYAMVGEMLKVEVFYKDIHQRIFRREWLRQHILRSMQELLSRNICSGN